MDGPEAKQNHSGIGIGVSSTNIWKSQFIAARGSKLEGLSESCLQELKPNKIGIGSQTRGSYCLLSIFPAVERCNQQNLHDRTRFCRCFRNFMRFVLSCFIPSILRPNQAIGDRDLRALTTRQVKICRCSMPHFT